MPALRTLRSGASGFTFRSLLIGAGLAFFINVACPYSVLVMRSAGLTSDYITAGAVMLFFILVGMVNPVLKRFSPRLALSTSELVLIYIMMIVACAIPTWGLVTNLFHILTRPSYFASPENDWETLILPWIKPWMAPADPLVSKYFYEGLPTGERIPWGAWAVPIFWWVAVMLAVYVVMISMMVIMRKQWVENEKLAFPIVQPALEMVRGNDTEGVNPIFRSRMMWAAFAFAFLIVSTRPLHYYFPTFPEIEMRHDYLLFRRTVRVLVFWNFAIIGLTYFINLDVAASFWVFHLLSKIETGIFNVAGFTLRGHNEALTGSCAATAHQGMGAMIVLSFFVLWAARRHLGDVLRKALGRAPQVDDSSEIMSYRAAAIGLALGLAFVLGWFVASGMPFLGAVAFMAGALCIFFAVTRIVAQGGVGFTAGQMIPQPFVVYGVGSEFMGPAGLTSLAYTYSWAAEIRTSVMTSAMNGLKLADSALADAQAGRKARRLLFWAMMLAIVAGLAGAIWTTLKLNYTHGGANLRMFGVPVIAFRFLEDKLRNPIASDIIWERWAFTGIGGTVMSVLVLLRHRLTWWPVHYVGFCIGDAWVMGWAWFGVFFCWLLKLFILWLGGMTLYNRLKPLFVGMILGQLMCGAFWLVVDLITGEVGNYVYIGVP